MLSIKNLSIRTKITLSILITSLSALFISSAAFVIFDIKNMKKMLVEEHFTIAKVIAHNSATAIVFNDPDSARYTLSALNAEPSIKASCIYGKDAQILASLGANSSGAMSFPLIVENGHRFIEDSLWIFQPVYFEGEKVGTVFLEIDLQELTSRIRNYILTIVAVLSSIFFVIYLFSSRIQKIISQPVLDLARIARAVSLKKDYSLRASRVAGGEIGELVNSFNEMLQEIQKKDDDLRRYRLDLEQRVSERTLELSTANEHLQKVVEERTRMQNDLMASESKFRAIMQMAPDAVVLMDWEGRIVYWNPAAGKMFGYSANEVIGKDLHLTLAPKRLHEDYKKGFAEMKKTRKSRFMGNTTEFTGLGKDGNEIPVDVSFSGVKLYERPYFIGIIRDITQRKLMEEDQIKAQRLESIGLLAGGIAHDFNNILTGILGNINLAKMYTDKDSKAYERLTRSEKSCFKAKDLTMQLLTFSRGGSPIKKVVDIRKFLRDAVSLAVSGSNIACEFDMEEDLRAAKIDEGQMNQVIQNLIINAQHAMILGGTIKVSAHNMEIPRGQKTQLSPGKYIKISVIDTGVGMPPDVLKRIFDPYFTTKEKGTGLGLSICFSIVKKHGGLITAESVLGKGTTFRIYLPALEKEIKVEKEVGEGDLKGYGRILVMDDEEIIRDVAEDILTSLGYKVVLAKDGEEAMDIYREGKEKEKPYDLVILDLTIPGGMGGQETASEILDYDPNALLMVVSGYANDPIMSNYKEYGFTDVVTKPFDAAKLGIVIKKVLSKK